jgi:hypothetical protein
MGMGILLSGDGNKIVRSFLHFVDTAQQLMLVTQDYIEKALQPTPILSEGIG